MRTAQWPTHRTLDNFALERTLGRYIESFRKRVQFSQRAACFELNGQPVALDHALFHNHNEQHARRKEAHELTTTPKPSPSPTSAFSASLIWTLLDSRSRPKQALSTILYLHRCNRNSEEVNSPNRVDARVRRLRKQRWRPVWAAEAEDLPYTRCDGATARTVVSAREAKESCSFDPIISGIPIYRNGLSMSPSC